MFTHGSRLLIIAAEVTACWGAPPKSGAPQTCATRAQTVRAARNFAMVANWSSVAARRNSS
ncbi:Uncharacterised protein [Mycobacteroides abscessus subsp. abscessus]|nr:Uncharacterised protein [Mycobacteroides abscessus subsp. abscessus]